MNLRVRAVALTLASLLVASPQRLFPQQTANSTARDYSKEPVILEKVTNTIQFENDGTYKADTDIRIRVLSAAGVQQAGLIQFPYASQLGNATISGVKVTKPNGTFVDTPADNVQDLPAQITVQAPMYSDLKIKQVAVRGLEPGNILEYRLSFDARSPLVPGQFWYSSNFAKGVVVQDEQLHIRLPRDRKVTVKSPRVSPAITDTGAYREYTWKTAQVEPTAASDDKKTAAKPAAADSIDAPPFDVQLTSFQDWNEFAQWFQQLVAPRMEVTQEIRTKADEITQGAATEDAKIRALYDHVATKFRYIGVSFGVGRFQPHAAADVLINGYGDCKDKHTLLAALLAAEGIKSYPALINSGHKFDNAVPAPGQFDHMITAIPRGNSYLWLDTTAEVAPFGMLLAPLRDNQALIIKDLAPPETAATPPDPPFPQRLDFSLDGRMSSEGKLTANVKVLLRGDVEVVLRSGFHRTSRAQWNTMIQAVSQAWTFAGDVSDVTADIPEATASAFGFQYEYNHEGYPNWPDVLHPPLPPLGLSELPDDGDTKPIHLESPGTYLLDAKVELPQNVMPRERPDVNIKRDFAEYHATYSASGNFAHIERRLTILKRELPRDRAAEYKTFRDAVLKDADTLMTLAGTPASSAATSSSSSVPAAKPSESLPEAEAEEAVSLGDALYNQKDYDAAIEQYRKALRLRPDSFNAHDGIGNALFVKRDFADAIIEYRAALAIKSDEADTHYYLARALLGQQQYDAAIAEYRETLRLNPSSAEAQGGLATAFMNQRQDDRAVEEAKKAVAIDAKYARGYQLMGEAYLNLRRDSDALEALRQVEKLAPNNTTAAQIAQILLRLKRNAEAATEAEGVLERYSGNPQLLLAAGQANVRTGNSQRGLSFLHDYLKAVSGPLALDAVSLELADHGLNVAEAVGYAKQAAEQMEDTTSTLRLESLKTSDLTNVNWLGIAWDILGWAHFKAGRNDEALKYITAAWKLGQTSSFGYRLGQLYEKTGNKQEAIHYYALALANPDPYPPEELTDRLAALAGGKAGADRAVDAVRPQLSESRTVILPKIVNKSASAEFFVVFSQASGGSVTDVQFISGADELGTAGPAAIKSAKFDVSFPDEMPTKILRRGILSCSSATPTCHFVLFPPASVYSIH